MTTSIRKILTLIITSSLFLTACGSDNITSQTTAGADLQTESQISLDIPSQAAEETDLTTEQQQLYETHIHKLDEMLVANEARLETCRPYQEFVDSIFLFHGGEYHGWLQADHDENGVAAIQMLIEEGQEGEISDDKQKWVGKVLEDGSLWLTYQSTYEEQYDLPDYIVNETVLRYSRAAYVYDDGSTDIELQKADNAQEITDALAEELTGSKKELWLSGDTVYQIDRENQQFLDVTQDLGGVLASFLTQQPERITGRLKGSEAAYAEVEKWKPEDYSQLGGWDYIAVSDLNKDGRDDYVVALYPNDFEEVRRYEEFSPYEKRSEYYAASFWLLLSGEDGTYEQIQLTHSIEYRQEDALTLVEVTFVEKNLLQLEYFVGRSPWYNAIIQFEYDEENKKFHVYRTYFRESCDGMTGKLLIGNQENYGEVSMYSYFAYSQAYNETSWDYADDVEITGRAMLGYYNNSFQYGCVNPLEEHHINSLIWEKEYELPQKLQTKYANKELEFSLIADDLYYNENIISGQMEGYGSVFTGQDEQRISKFIYPIMIDKNTYEYVSVTECIDKASFLQIYQNFVSEERQKEELDAEKIEHFENAIINYWDYADSMEHFLDNPEEILCLQIISEGVMIRTRAQDGSWLESMMIDRECFIGTDLWQYMKPEWMY